MKRLSLNIVVALVGLIFFGTIEASAQEKMKEKKVLWAAEDLKWEAMQGGVPGVMTAMLWGDPNGVHGGLTKFPAGFKAPLHYHTNEAKIVVIKGAYTYNGKKYGPGSYLSIPGGDKHESGGVDDSETIFFMQQPGTFDLVPVEPPSEKK